VNPQPYTTQQPRPNTYDRCDTCQHGWHGIKCVVTACGCASSFVDRYEQEAS
jgi:hypothetical protein